MYKLSGVPVRLIVFEMEYLKIERVPIGGNAIKQNL